MYPSFAEFPEVMVKKLRGALKVTDDVAFENVTQDNAYRSILDVSGAPIAGKFPRGGPFGAMLGVSYGCRFDQVGEAVGNNVIGSGIASRHAEDRALVRENYATLVSRLNTLKLDSTEAVAWMISSGQSCTTCHTKQEIAARALIERGSIAPGHFATLYGATYDQTHDIAKFYDAQYADAMILFARDPGHEGNLIKSTLAEFSHVPPQVQQILAEAVKPTAVVMRHDEVYAVGEDRRTDIDLFATAEVSAVRRACEKYRKGGAFASWEIDGTLYTTEGEIGPLLFAEMGWTRIKDVVHVGMPQQLAGKQFASRETSKLRNSEFLQIIAGGYDDPRAAVTVFRDEHFVNRAQPMWARVLQTNPEMLYNGDGVSDAVLAMRNSDTRFKFAARDLLCACRGPHEPQPLAALCESVVPGRVA